MNITYRPDIDGLRAVAIMSVLAYHSFPEVFPGGFVGVDVFFVISGFLITSILLEDKRGVVVGIAAFYARRILRIFPALILVLATCFFIGWYTLLADEYKQLGKYIFAGAGFFSNIAAWFDVGYFDNASMTKPLLHLWSLGIEEQFYIVWPCLILGLFAGRPRAMKWIAAMALLSLAYSCAEVVLNRTLAFYSPASRMWELLAGALLVCLHRQKILQVSDARRNLLSWLGFGLILAGVGFLRPNHPFPGVLALLPVTGAVLLIAAGPAAWVNQRLLSRPGMISVGLVSYPLYLWHWPILSFAYIMHSGVPDVALRMGLILLSLLLAVLTYLMVEKPLRRLHRKTALVLLAGLLLIVGFLGKNVFDRDGLTRIRHRQMLIMNAEASEDFVDFEKRGLITKQTCDHPFQFPEKEVCLISQKEQPPTAVVVGDSHAVHAYWGLSAALVEKGENLKVMGRGACAPLLGYLPDGDQNGCQPYVDESLHYIADTASIRQVIFVFRGRYLNDNTPSSEVLKFRTALDSTLKMLREKRKKVYYFYPVVEPDFDPRLCVATLPLGRKPPYSCTIDRVVDNEKTRILRTNIDAVLAKYPDVVRLDPNDVLCIENQCPIVQTGHSLFKDENHLSHSGSMRLGKLMTLSYQKN